MARAFDPMEIQRVTAALMRAGLDRFTRDGIRATRIDNLCRDAGIAKGSFYAFFPSKEELFMAIAQKREALHRADMLRFIVEGQDRRACADGFFEMVVTKIETDPVLTVMMAHGEVAYLMRKLGPEWLQQNQESEARFVADIAAKWPQGPVNAKDLLALLTLTLTLTANKSSMTPEQYRPALALLKSMFTSRLTGDGR